MGRDPGLHFDAATALAVLLAELIVELVDAGALDRVRAARVLRKAESFIEALRVERAPDRSPGQNQVAVELHRLAVSQVIERVERKLAARPSAAAPRPRRRKRGRRSSQKTAD